MIHDKLVSKSNNNAHLFLFDGSSINPPGIFYLSFNELPSIINIGPLKLNDLLSYIHETYTHDPFLIRQSILTINTDMEEEVSSFYYELSEGLAITTGTNMVGLAKDVSILYKVGQKPLAKAIAKEMLKFKESMGATTIRLV